MHGMLAGDRHAAQDRLRLALRRHLSVLQLISNDLVVELGVEPILVEKDAGAALSAFGESRSETNVQVSMASALRVLERDQESAGVGLVIAVVAAAPGIDIDGA